MTKILITGASGQLGIELTHALQTKYETENVIASDLKMNKGFKGIYEDLDATDIIQLRNIIHKHKITQIYHLAAILSANGEKDPIRTWEVNMQAFLNVLEVSKSRKIEKVFYPSSIAVFGPDVDRLNTPQSPNLTPTTVYGISKVAGENWARYYFEKYGLDVRSIRFPGIIGYKSLPGGGTTDYAIDIFHKAVSEQKFECFLKSDTFLPMIYMEDAIRATLELMDAPKEDIRIRTSYNVSGMSFSPTQLAQNIKKIIPEFEIKYKPDFRQEIAESWPMSIDDSDARKDWNWRPKFNLEKMTNDMLMNLLIINNSYQGMSLTK